MSEDVNLPGEWRAFLFGCLFGVRAIPFKHCPPGVALPARAGRLGLRTFLAVDLVEIEKSKASGRSGDKSGFRHGTSKR
jgi:hypothetical protein